VVAMMVVYRDRYIKETQRRKIVPHRKGFHVLFLDNLGAILGIKSINGNYLALKEISFNKIKYYEYDILTMDYYLLDEIKWQHYGMLVYKNGWKILTYGGCYNFVEQGVVGSYRVEYTRICSIFEHTMHIHELATKEIIEYGK